MTGLICLSPKLLDHTFPRDEDELRKVAICIGQVEEVCLDKRAALVSLESLQNYLDEFSWEGAAHYPLLHDIYISLLKLLVHSGELTIQLDVSGISEYCDHPLPPSCDGGGVPELWQSEMGKLLAAHDAACDGGRFFIGLACDHAFSSEDPVAGASYESESLRAFPLIGPSELSTLDDAFIWDVTESDIRGEITVASAKANIHLLGGKLGGQSSSHIKVEFAGARPWSLDCNVDPQPERFLKQIADKSGYPYVVVRYALRQGSLPEKVFRLAKFDRSHSEVAA